MKTKFLNRIVPCTCLVWACGIATIWRPAFADFAGSAYIPAGLVVLDQTANPSVSMSGSSNVAVGSVFVNSSAATAVKATGSASITTANLYVVGGTSFASTPGCSGTITTMSAPVADPMSSLAFPSTTGQTDLGTCSLSGGAKTISPGYYSGGITVSGGGQLTLSPGVYLLGNKGLSISSSGLSGTGVTIVFLSGSLSMSGGSTVSLTPCMSGGLAGVTLAQPSANTSKFTLSGGSGISIQGVIYAPAAPVSLSGSSTIAGDGPVCGEMLIAKTVSLSGSGTIKIGRTSAGQNAPLPSAGGLQD